MQAIELCTTILILLASHTTKNRLKLQCNYCHSSYPGPIYMSYLRQCTGWATYHKVRYRMYGRKLLPSRSPYPTVHIDSRHCFERGCRKSSWGWSRSSFCAHCSTIGQARYSQRCCYKLDHIVLVLAFLLHHIYLQY
jgi:hypothetical protein